MRQKATIEEWKELYETATMLREMEPWNYFWDMDLVALQEDEMTEPVFVSVLGKGGECYGYAMYEGYEALNSFMMLTMHEKLNISSEYAMYSQKNLTCYLGNRDELTTEQRSIVKELGYKYRGANQWMYFMSFEPGYYPYNLNQEEVLKMIRYQRQFIKALEYYRNHEIKVSFDKEKMYLFTQNVNNGMWTGREENLPFTFYQFPSLLVTDEELLKQLKKSKHSPHILEADIIYMGISVSDKKYDKPGNPRLCMIADSISKVVLIADMIEPEQDANVCLAENIIGFIEKFGAPKEIRVSNILVETILDQICENCGIKLRRVKRLPALSDFLNQMQRFQ